MTARPDRRWSAPAALASLALHGAVLAAGLMLFRSSAPATPPSGISVTLVREAPVAAPAAAAETVAEASPSATEPARMPIEQAAPPPGAPTMSSAGEAASPTDEAAVEQPPAAAPVPTPKHKPRSARRVAVASAPQSPPSPAMAIAPSAIQAVEPSLPSAGASADRQPIAVSAAAETTEDTATAPPPSSSSSVRDYLADIMAALTRHKRYPETARMQRQEGTVLIAFSIDRGGRVLSFDIRRGSGSVALDDAAAEMIRRSDPLPAAPPTYAGARLDLVLPVTFNLQ